MVEHPVVVRTTRVQFPLVAQRQLQILSNNPIPKVRPDSVRGRPVGKPDQVHGGLGQVRIVSSLNCFWYIGHIARDSTRQVPGRRQGLVPCGVPLFGPWKAYNCRSRGGPLAKFEARGQNHAILTSPASPGGRCSLSIPVVMILRAVCEQYLLPIMTSLKSTVFAKARGSQKPVREQGLRFSSMETSFLFNLHRMAIPWKAIDVPQPLLQLASPVTDLPRIGPAKAKALKKLHLGHARDFLFTFPRRYDDFSEITPVAKLEVGKQQVVHGRVTSVKSKAGFAGRRRLIRIFVDIEDGTGTLAVTWFNLPFIAKQLSIGTELYVAGKVEANTAGSYKLKAQYRMRSPSFEFAGKQSDRMHTAAITPIYPETHGVTSRFIRYQVKTLLPLVAAVPEYLPKEIIKRNKFIDIQTALRAIHFPRNRKELDAATSRLRFDELFFLQLAALVRREKIRRTDAPVLDIAASVKRYQATLPYALTGAQQRALGEITHDVKLSHPMNRLLQGDVGSGKSAIALLAAAGTLESGVSTGGRGYKVLYLAPTEILARQQFQVFQEFLGGQRVHLLVGALSGIAKKSVKQKLLQEDPCIVIGTHALFQEDVSAKNIGLTIIDEQHRFGVNQRAALQNIQKQHPHLLSMTATPIPRTLNLTVYGDLDVSVLDELPPGRQPIVTKIIPPAGRENAIVHVLEELHRGRQGYVIAPLVEESEKLQLKSAKQAYEEMKKLFPGVAVGLVHGRMKSEEKDAAMRNFAAGAIQLLVSTAVVEVGVNVPNATVMIIEGAERFGLAQLHQFRGRIGRGQYASTCYLFPTTAESATSRRLNVIEQTQDGFKIAEEDLQLRGPGEVYGLAQSGFSDLQVASLLDYPTIKLARQEADEILQKDPELVSYPILRKKVEQKNLQTHFE